MGKDAVITSFLLFHLCSVLRDRLFLFLSGFLVLVLVLGIRVLVHDHGSGSVGMRLVGSLYSSKETSNVVRIVVIGGASGDVNTVRVELDSDMWVGDEDGDGNLQIDSFVPVASC